MCTQKDCCLPKAKCSEFKCATGLKIKPKAQWLLCKVDPCLPEEETYCCEKDDNKNETKTGPNSTTGATENDSGDASLHLVLGLLFLFAIAATVLLFLRGKKNARQEKADLTRTRLSMQLGGPGRCTHAHVCQSLLAYAT
jgi:hypothetical protein